jgi:hypothetical protein
MSSTIPWISARMAVDVAFKPLVRNGFQVPLARGDEPLERAWASRHVWKLC